MLIQKQTLTIQPPPLMLAVMLVVAIFIDLLTTAHPHFPLPYSICVLLILLPVIVLRQIKNHHCVPIPRLPLTIIIAVCLLSFGLLALPPERGVVFKATGKILLIFLIAPVIITYLAATMNILPVTAMGAVALHCLVPFLSEPFAQSLPVAAIDALLLITLPYLLRDLPRLLKHRFVVAIHILLPSLIVFTSTSGWYAFAFLFAFAGMTFLLDRPLHRWWLTGSAAATVFFLLSSPNHPLRQLPVTEDDSLHFRRLYIEYQCLPAAIEFYPIGAGPGRYLHTIRFITNNTIPPVLYPRENKIPLSSNSTWQILGVEHGIPGLLAFCMLLGSCLWARQPCRKVLPLIGNIIIAASFSHLFQRGLNIVTWTVVVHLCVPAITVLRIERVNRLPRVILPLLVPVILILIALITVLRLPPSRDSYFNAITRRITFCPPFSEPVAATPPQRSITQQPDSAAPIVLDLTAHANQQSEYLHHEAEDYASITPPFTLHSDNIHKVTSLHIPEHAGKNRGQATYLLDIPQSGDYLFQAKVWWNDGCGNSLRVTIGPYDFKIMDETYACWHVVSAFRPLRLKAGKAVLRLHGIEDGIRIDWFRLKPLASNK
ncbi:MAG: hypothetical protein D6820_05955 [Lentisphaerae bacterium]|nr:MAG: hypothetical protein D6820_05955 [Lentisphaerota bacterium]